MVFGWGSSSATDSLASKDVEENEVENVKSYMRAGDHILNDDIVSAEKELSDGGSSYHLLSRGLLSFMRASLGFEKNIMAEASQRLYAAEAHAYDNQRKAQSIQTGSGIYPPGTQYALMQAQAQIMLAIVGIMNQSVTESLKGFYKIRKAYMSLHAIKEAEDQYVAKLYSTSNVSSKTSLNSSVNKSNGYTDSSVPIGIEVVDPSIFQDPVDSFIHSGINMQFGMLQLFLSFIPPSLGKFFSIIGFQGDLEHGKNMLWQATRTDNVSGALAAFILSTYYNSVYRTNDMVLLDQYPSSQLETLIGRMRQRYPSDRLFYLEQARKYAATHQLQKAHAMLYSPDLKVSQLKQMEALLWFEKSLASMHMHNYVDSAAAFKKNVELSEWSHALYLYLAGASHLELSRLYKYGGVAFSTSVSESGDANAGVQIPTSTRKLETYIPNTQLAAHHAALAEDLLFVQVPAKAGKKKMFNRQMPMDAFVGRKVAKWRARAEAWDVSLLEAVGVSPFVEMQFWWGGFMQMGEEELRISQARLDWSDGKENMMWSKEGLDEKAILALLRASISTKLKKREETRKLLREEIIEGHQWHEFKGLHKDNWSAPIARYEMAVTYWDEYWENPHEGARGQKPSLDRQGSMTKRRPSLKSRRSSSKSTKRALGDSPQDKLLDQCHYWLDQVATWESYDLDVRAGIKVKTAQRSLKELLERVELALD